MTPCYRGYRGRTPGSPVRFVTVQEIQENAQGPPRYIYTELLQYKRCIVNPLRMDSIATLVGFELLGETRLILPHF